MSTIKVPSLNGDKIVEQYPKSVEAFTRWLGTFPNLESIGTDTDKQILLNSIKAIFYYNPRALYEFFDQAQLELQITKLEGGWYPSIGSVSNLSMLVSRIEAEEAGFQACFDRLEEKLNG